MPDIPALIQSGTASVWLLLPVAIVLGALHALEPGHSKSMMTAFIVAIHGSAAQAVVLALSVTVGHTIVVCPCRPWPALQDTESRQRPNHGCFSGGLLIVVLAFTDSSVLSIPWRRHARTITTR
jgi:hypothetical protein